MGNGKGNPEYWVAEIQPGKVLYEMEGVTEELAREAFPPCCGKASDRDHLRCASHRCLRNRHEKQANFRAKERR